MLEKIFDLFLHYGIRGLFKTVVVIFEYYEKNLVSGKFEDIMEFLSEMPKMSIFSPKDYNKFIQLKNNGSSFDIIKKAIPDIRACNFVYTFKEKCERINIPVKFVDLLENKYRIVSTKIKK